MDPEKLEAAITSRTRAIVPVHLYGQPADMDALQAIADRHGIPVVEDACQAHGAQHNGRKAGAIGLAGCFSFYPSKNLGCCGEGGAVATRDPQLAQRMRLLRDHGSTRKYEHEIPGFNLRMQGLQGAVLRAKLVYLDLWNESRRALASLYTKRLANPDIVTPVEKSYAHHVYHLYVVQLKNRDAVCERLKAAQIETGLHYPTPLHLQPAYKSLGYRHGDFPVAEQLAERILSLPMYPELPQRAVEYVADALLEACESQSVLSNAATETAGRRIA
jgi:dTDP-4-amino-4,6-dideoxygalactose transaminase